MTIAVLALTGCGVERGSAVALDSEAGVEPVDAGGATVAETTPTTVAPEPTPVPSTAPADEVAITAELDGEEWTLTHGQLNDVVIPTWENEVFVANAFQGVVPPNFYAGVAGDHLVSEVIRHEIEKLGGSVEATTAEQAEANIMGVIQGWFAGSADPGADASALIDEVPYLDFVIEFQARQESLLTTIAESAEATVEAPCVRHILTETEADADEVLAELNAGADFTELAAERSIGPTGPTGGDLGCAPSSSYVPEFAAAVDGAELGEYVGPVQSNFGWHVLIVDRTEPIESDPTPLANELITNALSNATVEVDPRIGEWDSTSLAVVPADIAAADSESSE